jgi:hypothetical protein
MRKAAAWGIAATLTVGLGIGFAVAADDTTEGTGGRSTAWAPTWQWKPFSGWFGTKAPKEELKPVEKKPAPKAEPAAVNKSSALVKPASIVDEAVARRSREEAALLRRLRACDKLREIAIRCNDNGLLHRAEELEERAQATYAQRTAHLQANAAAFESDEQTIDRYLDTGKPHSESPPAYVVSSKDPSRQAVAKEVKP